nr:MAG TPA: hypothetical protein [Caudoviricetes sp.]
MTITATHLLQLIQPLQRYLISSNKSRSLPYT